MALLSVLVPGITLNLLKPISTTTPLKFTNSITVPFNVLPTHSNSISVSQWVRTSTLSNFGTLCVQLLVNIEPKMSSIPMSCKQAKRGQREDAGNYESANNACGGQDKASGEVVQNQSNEPDLLGSSFLITIAIPLAIATVLTILSVGMKQPSSRFFGVRFLNESSLPSTLPMGFSFKAFGYRIILPEYAPGWIYFWLLMAAGCGLFISEEALNIWVGISLSRMLSLDGTWQSFVESFSRNAPYIVSTVLWVYWGVCISDMMPFYLGKLFRQSGASDDICSKVCAFNLLCNFMSADDAYAWCRQVNRLSSLLSYKVTPLGFADNLEGISPECFLAGVCCGCLIALPLQLGIGFLSRERPVFALATVATVVGVWTVFPYAVAALTAFYLYLRNRYTK